MLALPHVHNIVCNGRIADLAAQGAAIVVLLLDMTGLIPGALAGTGVAERAARKWWHGWRQAHRASARLVRIDGVVDERPADAGAVQRQHDGPIAAAAHRRPAQQRAPVECQAQERLRLRALRRPPGQQRLLGPVQRANVDSGREPYGSLDCSADILDSKLIRGRHKQTFQ